MHYIFRPFRFTIAAAFFALFSSLAQAGNQPSLPDWVPVPVSKSWTLEKSNSVEFDEMKLPLDAFQKNAQGQYLPIKADTIEGRMWVGRFTAPESASFVQLKKEVQHAMQSAGFQSIYSCEKDTCFKGEAADNFVVLEYPIIPGYKTQAWFGM